MKQIKRAIYSIGFLLLIGAMLCGTAFAGDNDLSNRPFPDVPAGANYMEAAVTLAELGIFQGDSAGNFNPNKTISRAEAATVICRMLGVEEDAKNRTDVIFNDVSVSHWAVGYISKAAELGIIGGYGNGKFGPEDPVTQEQIVKMLVCAWGYEYDATVAGGYPNGYINVANDLGILFGIRTVPSDPAPRSVVASLVYNTLMIEPYIG